MRSAKCLKIINILKPVVPAYLGPALMCWGQASLIGDERLLRAGPTTIAVASALAALVVASFTEARRDLLPCLQRPRRAFFLAALVCAGLSLAVVLPLVMLGVGGPWLLVDAVPSAAIGGGITAWMRSRAHRRQDRRPPPPVAGDPPPVRHSATRAGVGLVLGLVIVGGTSGTGCHSPKPPPLIPALSPIPPGGVESGVWSTFNDVARTCSVWAQTARAEAESRQSRQRKLGVASSVAGALAIAAGVTGGALSANEDDSDKALTIASIGGIGASVFGLIATGSGIWASRQAGPSAAADDVERAIARSVSLHSIAALHGAQVDDRTDQVVEQGVALVRACAEHARRLDVLRDLPVPTTESRGVQRVAAVARSAKAEPPAATRAALYPQLEAVKVQP